MDHVEKQLRDYFAARLQTIPAFGNRIFVHRAHNLTPAELPAVVITSGDESIEKATRQNRPAIQKRMIPVMLYVVARAPQEQELMDQLDELKALIEEVIWADSTLQSLAAETIMVSSEPFVGTDPDSPTGIFRITFICTVFTMEGSPRKALQQ